MQIKANGIILAGGQSRRMGTDKALVQLTASGPRLIELVIAAMQPLVDSIVISTNRPADYQWLHLPLVRDNFPQQGPLAGLEATLALTSTANELNLVLACDMPAVQTALLQFLLERAHRQPENVAVVPLGQSGYPEPLCAVYRRSALPYIRQQLVSGQLKLTGWLKDAPVDFVPVSEIELFDAELRSFANLNTPQETADFRAAKSSGS